MQINSYKDCGTYYKAQVTLYDSSYYSNEKVLRTLDFEFTPVQETLRRVTRAYLEEKKR